MSSSSSSSRSTRSVANIELSFSQVMANAELSMKLASNQALQIRKEVAAAKAKVKSVNVVMTEVIPVADIVIPESAPVSSPASVDWETVLTALANITIRAHEYAGTLEMKRSRNLNMLLEENPILSQKLMRRTQAIHLIQLFSGDVHKVETVISTIISSAFFPVIYLDQAEKVVRSFPSEAKLHLAPEHQARTRVWELLFSNKKVDVESNVRLAFCMIADSCGGTRYAQYLVNSGAVVEETKASLKSRFRLLSEQVIEETQTRMEKLLEKYLFVSADSREVLSSDEELAISSFQITTLRKESKQEQKREEQQQILSPPVRTVKRKATSDVEDDAEHDNSVTEVEESGDSNGSGSDSSSKNKRIKMSSEQRKHSHVQAQQRYYLKKKQHQDQKPQLNAHAVMAAIVHEQTEEMSELKQMRQQMETLLGQIKSREERLQHQQ